MTIDDVLKLIDKKMEKMYSYDYPYANGYNASLKSVKRAIKSYLKKELLEKLEREKLN